MAQSNITVKIDESIKKEFNYFCEKLGLNMSTAINLFIYSVLREKRIPLNLDLNSEYNTKTTKSIKNVIKKKNLSKTFNSVSELMEDLNA